MQCIVGNGARYSDTVFFRNGIVYDNFAHPESNEFGRVHQ